MVVQWQTQPHSVVTCYTTEPLPLFVGGFVVAMTIIYREIGGRKIGWMLEGYGASVGEGGEERSEISIEVDWLSVCSER